MNHNALLPEGFDALETPCLLLDLPRMRRNLERLSAHMERLGGHLRPHVKTHKSVPVAREVQRAGRVQGITVSTLREADYFFAHGFRDILYGAGITPNKIIHAADLLKQGCRLQLTVDSPEMAQACAQAGEAQGVTFPIMIELDTDGHRAGALPRSDRLIEVGRLLHSARHTELAGVMTHAGESYGCDTAQARKHLAQQERDRSLLAASRLRDAGLPCPVVSVGSTPTAFAIDDLQGVTEVRAGVYTFFDLVMAGIGMCSLEDIALSVLVSVSGYQRERNWLITDGGWTALSRDRGTQSQRVDQGYGVVTDRNGTPLQDLVVVSTNQEHGVVSRREGDAPLPWQELPIGSLLQVLPNHACATAAQYSHFHVVEDGEIIDRWERLYGS
ncbi:MAG: alanine racemase [Pseudomonadota bacterium]